MQAGVAAPRSRAAIAVDGVGWGGRKEDGTFDKTSVRLELESGVWTVNYVS